MSDDVEKVFKIPIGLVAMSGLDLVTDALLAHLASPGPGQLPSPARLVDVHEEVKSVIAPDAPWFSDAGSSFSPQRS